MYAKVSIWWVNIILSIIQWKQKFLLLLQVLAILGFIAAANAGVFELPQAHYGHAYVAQPEPFDVSIYEFAKINNETEICVCFNSVQLNN